MQYRQLLGETTGCPCSRLQESVGKTCKGRMGLLPTACCVVAVDVLGIERRSVMICE